MLNKEPWKDKKWTPTVPPKDLMRTPEWSNPEQIPDRIAAYQDSLEALVRDYTTLGNSLHGDYPTFVEATNKLLAVIDTYRFMQWLKSQDLGLLFDEAESTGNNPDQSGLEPTKPIVSGLAQLVDTKLQQVHLAFMVSDAKPIPVGKVFNLPEESNGAMRASRMLAKRLGLNVHVYINGNWSSSYDPNNLYNVTAPTYKRKIFLEDVWKVTGDPLEEKADILRRKRYDAIDETA